MISRLQQGRMVYVADPITDAVALTVVAQLQALENSPEPASLYLTGKGGPTSAIMAIYEALRATTFAVGTIAMGRVEGWAALLVAAGEPGARCAAPQAYFVIGPPAVDGEGLDMQSYLQRVRSVSEIFTKMLAHHTGQAAETIAQIKQPRQLSAQQAIEFGLIDVILESA